MPQFQLAVATRCLREPLHDALKTARTLQVKGVQLEVREELPPDRLTETGRRDFLHGIREMGLQVSGTVFTLRRPLGSEIELDRKMAALRAAMDFTAQLHAAVMCCPLGRLADQPTPAEASLLREVLDDLCRHGNHVGVTLALTPANDDAAMLRELVAGVATGPVGIDFDPGYFAMTAVSSSKTLRALHGFIAHVQLRDGVRNLAGGGEECAVGRGSVDWLELLALLGEMDYAGWLTAIRTQGDDPPGDIAQALSATQRLLLGGA